MFGPLWQSDLARALSVNDRTVRRWVAGDVPIPAGLWYEVKQLLKQRGHALAAVRRKFPR
jgi:DNA-binding transcriptional regulator YiaG